MTHDDKTLRNQLSTLIRSWNLELDGELRDDASLISSGVFDSLALFNLALWVEEQVGASLDPTSFDLLKEWDTVATLLTFIKRRRKS